METASVKESELLPSGLVTSGVQVSRLVLVNAYAAYQSLVRQQSVSSIKRSEFKAMVVPLVQDQFGICLRNDLVINERSGIRGWKNVKLIQALPG